MLTGRQLRLRAGGIFRGLGLFERDYWLEGEEVEIRKCENETLCTFNSKIRARPMATRWKCDSWTLLMAMEKENISEDKASPV